MHSSDLVELAAILGTHAAALFSRNEPLSAAGLSQYWTASKCRQQRWNAELKAFSRAVQSAPPATAARLWPSIQGVLEETLASELLTRVWTAFCCGFEAQRGVIEATPIVRNVWAGQLEARRQTLNLIMFGGGLRLPQAEVLNRSRTRHERWTDVLLSRLAGFCDTDEFAHSAARVRELRDDAAGCHDREAAWAVTKASLSAAYQGDAARPANPEFNQQIAGAILSCLPRELPDSASMTRSLWLVRLLQVATDAQVMIDELVALEA